MTSDAVDYSRLREGLCPVHGSLLDRREDHGWCEECKCGWSMTPDEITVQFEAKSIALDEKAWGSGTVYLTRPAPG
jgi:hypothetical protein